MTSASTIFLTRITLQKRSGSPTENATGWTDVGKCQRGPTGKQAGPDGKQEFRRNFRRDSVGFRRVLCADLDERAFACVYKFGERAFAFGSL